MQPMGPMLLFGDPHWRDIHLTVDAMPFEGGGDGFKVVFAAQDGHNLFGVGFGSYKNHWHDIWRIIDGEFRTLDAAMPSQVEGQVEYGRWHHVSIDSRDGHIRCELDCELILDTCEYRLPSGFVGLSTWDALVRFRNVVVEDRQGHRLWDGLPELPHGRSVTVLS